MSFEFNDQTHMLWLVTSEYASSGKLFQNIRIWLVKEHHCSRYIITEIYVS